MQEAQETGIHSLGCEDPLEEETASHPSVLAWRMPWTQKSLAGYSPWGCKESGMTEATQQQKHSKKEARETSVADAHFTLDTG